MDKEINFVYMKKFPYDYTDFPILKNSYIVHVLCHA